MKTLGLRSAGGTLHAAGVERRGRERVSALAKPDDVPTMTAWAPDAAVIGLPLHAVAHRVLDLPFADPARLAAVVPLELAGQLPFEIEDHMIAHTVLARDRASARVLAAVARRTNVAELVDQVTRGGLPRPTVVLDILAVLGLVPAARADVALLLVTESASVAVRRGGRLVGLRALGAAGTDVPAVVSELRWSLAAFGDVPATIVVAGPTVGEALVAALTATFPAVTVRLGEVVDHRASEIDVTTAAIEYALATSDVTGPGMLVFGGVPPLAVARRRRVRRLVAAAAVLGLLDLAAYRHGLVRREVALAAAIMESATAALPGERIVAPRAQLESALTAATNQRRRLGPSGGSLELLRDLSERIPRGMRLELDELELATDGLLLHGRVDTFDQVDALRRALSAAPVLAGVTTDDTRTTVDGRRVEFHLRARLRTPGETAS